MSEPMFVRSNLDFTTMCALLLLAAGMYGQSALPSTGLDPSGLGLVPSIPDESCMAWSGQTSSPVAAKRARQLLEAEWKAGSRLASDVDKHTQIVRDPRITAYLDSIERSLVRASSLDGCFTVRLIVDPEPNASSLPGGFIYLTTGLMQMVQNEDELAAALAHETAHVIARHLSRVEKRRRRWGRIAFVAGPLGLGVRTWVGPFLTMKIVRDYELDADMRGLRYYTAAGYERDFAAILELASTDDGENPSFSDKLLDNHPPTHTRIDLIHRARTKMAAPQTRAPTDSDAFLSMKEHFATLDLSPYFE